MLSQLACGIRKRTRPRTTVMPIQDCSKVLQKLLRELLRFTPMKLPVRPSTKSQLTLRPEADGLFGGRTRFAPLEESHRRQLVRSSLPLPPTFNFGEEEGAER